MSDICEGSVYIASLSSFVKNHESQLMDTQLIYNRFLLKDTAKKSKILNNEQASTTTPNSSSDDSSQKTHDVAAAPDASNSSDGMANAVPHRKLVRLSLTLHHLYFLLDSFGKINLESGPLNIRIFDVDYESVASVASNLSTSDDSEWSKDSINMVNDFGQEYVSFLSNHYYNTKAKRISNYASSINSNNSMTSMSSVKSAFSTLWNSFSLNYNNPASNKGHPDSEADEVTMFDNPAIVNYLKYLNISMSKITSLRLAPDVHSKLIKNFEEYPFDRATPLTIFRNLQFLEIDNVKPNDIFGWNLLASMLRIFTIKNVDMNNRLYMIFIELPWQDQNNRNTKHMAENSGMLLFKDDFNISTSSLPSSPINTSSFNYNNTSLMSSQSNASSISAGSSPSMNGEKKKGNRKKHKSFSTLRKKKASGRHQTLNNTSSNDQNDHHHARSTGNMASLNNKAASSSSSTAHLPSVSGNELYPSLSHPFYESKWKYITYLSFTNTNLSTLLSPKDNGELSDEFFKLFENLTFLDLSKNRFRHIPTSIKYLTNLKSLNLNDNMISDVKVFRKMYARNKEKDTYKFSIKNLNVLLLKNNSISNLEGIECLVHLTKLDVSNNKIQFLKDFKYLILSAININKKDEIPFENNKILEKSCLKKNKLRINPADITNVELLLDVNNFKQVILTRNVNRMQLTSLHIAGNPLQYLDKNYRIKLFNLFSVLGWVSYKQPKCMKINGYSPSYIEAYYLMSNEEINKLDVMNADSSKITRDKSSYLDQDEFQIILNFKKYLFDKDPYFHQFKSNDTIEDFIRESGNTELRSAGLLKSISNYSLQLFSGAENDRAVLKHDRSLLMPKDNPINIKNNKLYYINPHRTISSETTIKGLSSPTTSALSPTNVTFDLDSVSPNNNSTNDESIQISTKNIIATNAVQADRTENLVDPVFQIQKLKPLDRTALNYSKPSNLVNLEASKSLSNLLNLSKALNLEDGDKEKEDDTTRLMKDFSANVNNLGDKNIYKYPREVLSSVPTSTILISNKRYSIQENDHKKSTSSASNLSKKTLGNS